MGRIVTLTTDFGLADEFVGVMKGVILGVAPSARIVDLTHQVAPHDVRQAAFLLAAAWPFFPAGTVHLAVVDPGVGSARRLVALEAAGQLFLAPDNGLLSLVLAANPRARAWRIDNRELYPGRVGATFHGRDILAPVAARLAGGVDPDQVGPALAVADLLRLPDLEPSVDGASGRITGRVEQVDRFGNLVTNIGADLLRELGGDGGRAGLRIQCGGREVRGLAGTFSDLPAGVPLALIGSRGCLELAVNQGRAEEVLAAGVGYQVTVKKE